MRWVKATLLSAFLAYSVGWSFISLSRLFTLNAFIFDLGVAMDFAWAAFHRFGPVSLLHNFAYKGIVYLIGPLFLAGGYPIMLIFQSAFIGLAVFPLYGIARHYLKSEVPALLLSVSYLIYFPLAGTNWFDFHYQALFPTLFILGYYFYVARRPGLSLLFMALSGITHYPFTLFPMMFALGLMGGWLLKGRREDLKLALPLLAFTGLIFAMNLWLSGIAGSTLGTIGYAFGPAPIEPKIYAVVLIFLPLFFLPALSPKWMAFMVPFLVLVAITNSPYIYWPFMDQYGSLFAPFLFLGGIEAAAALGRRRPSKRSVLVIAATVFVSVSAFAIVYEPYGPLNGNSALNNYHVGNVLGSWAAYGELLKVASLVPDNYSILSQINIPEVLPSHGNITVLDVPPYAFTNNPPVDYGFAYVYSPYFYEQYGFPPNQASMYSAMQGLWNGGDYGIAAEASGLLLLKHDYTGSPEYYVPIDMTFRPTELYAGNATVSSNYINATGVNGEASGVLWYGPYTTLYPGLYNVTFWLYTSNASASNKLQLQVTANYTNEFLDASTISGDQLSAGAWTPVTLTFYAGGIYGGVEFRGVSTGWNGTLLLSSIRVEQAASGLPTSYDQYVLPWQLGYQAPVNLTSSGLLEAVNLTNAMAWYGPYTTVRPGFYNVTFLLRSSNDSPMNRAELQITSGSGRTYLATMGLTGSEFEGSNWTVISVPLAISSTQEDVEFRCFVQGWNGSLELANVTVIREGTSPSPNTTWNYGPSQLWVPSPSLTVNGLISASNVSGTTIWYGPYTTLYPGLYNVTFWLYTTNSSPLNELQLQVTANSGSVYLTTSVVNGSSLRPFAWTPITMSFRTSSTYNDVEFRGYVVNWDGEVGLNGINETFIAPDG